MPTWCPILTACTWLTHAYAYGNSGAGLQVLSGVDGFLTDLPSTEDAIKPVETLISEAYQEIDKAVVKGILHTNTGARRKAKLAAAKRHLLTEAGLYSPQ